LDGVLTGDGGTIDTQTYSVNYGVGAVMAFHNVTARRQAEIALSTSEVRFRTIFNRAAVGITVTELAGRFLQANEKILAGIRILNRGVAETYLFRTNARRRWCSCSRA
jgi:PAS domain-containing protein